MKNLFYYGALMALVSSCSFSQDGPKNKKVNQGDSEEKTTPIVKPKLVAGTLVARDQVYQPFTVNKPMQIQFSVVGTSLESIEKYSYRGTYLGAVDEAKKEVPESFFQNSHVSTTRREDGLFDHNFTIPFLANANLVGGVKLQLVIEDLKDTEGNPSVLTTDFLLDESSYNTIHKNATSVLQNYAVLQEDAYGLVEGEQVNLLGLIERVESGENPTTGDLALEDVRKAREAWKIEDFQGKRVLVPQQPVHLSISYPGEAIIYNKHAVPISIVSDDASQLTIYMASCKKLKNCDVSKPDLRLITMKPPKVLPIDGAFDGHQGEDASLQSFTTCSQEIYNMGLPRHRALCENQFDSFHGSDYSLQFQVMVGNLGQATLPVHDISKVLAVKTGDVWNLEFWENQRKVGCSNKNCIVTYDNETFDIYSQEMDMARLSGTVAANFRTKLDEMPEVAREEYAEGVTVLEKVDSVSTYFMRGESNQNISGFSEAWSHSLVDGDGIYVGWTDNFCREVMPDTVSNWITPDEAFQEFRGSSPKFMNKKKAGYTSYKNGEITKTVALEEYLDLRHVKIVGASIQKGASLNSGTLSVYPYVAQNGEFVSDVEKVEQPNGETIISLPQNILNEIKPVTSQVVLEGNVGNPGFPNPTVSLATAQAGNFEAELESLAGTYGLKGNDFVLDGFKAGKLGWRASYAGGQPLIDFLYVQTPAGKADCTIPKLQAGQCQYDYFPKRLTGERGDIFNVDYHVGFLEGEVATPYTSFNSVEGIQLFEQKHSYDRKKFMQLYGMDEKFITRHGFNTSLSSLQSRGGSGRESGKDVVSQRYFEGGHGATGFYTMYSVEEPQVRQHGLSWSEFRDGAIDVISVVAGPPAALYSTLVTGPKYGAFGSEQNVDAQNMAFFSYLKSNYEKNNDGVYVVWNKSNIKGVNTKVDCNEVAKNPDSRFKDFVIFQPEHLPEGLTRQSFDREGFYRSKSLQRPLKLNPDFIKEMRDYATRFFPEGGYFRSVETTCDDALPSSCRTTFDFLATFTLKETCNKGPFEDICYKTGAESSWEKAEIRWFANPQTEYVQEVASKCEDKQSSAKSDFDVAAENFVQGLETETFTGLLKDLIKLKPMYVKAFLGGDALVNGNPASFISMYQELEQFKDTYFTSEDLPDHVRPFIKLKNNTSDFLTLPELYSIVHRLSSYSELRRSLDRYLLEQKSSKYGFTWESLGEITDEHHIVVEEEGKDPVKKSYLTAYSGNTSMLSKAYKQWKTLPTLEELSRMLHEISNVMNILRPKIKQLQCAYSLNGKIKKYDKPYFKSETLSFNNASKFSSEVELGTDKWENTFGEDKKVVKIKGFDNSPLHREVRFKREKVSEMSDTKKAMVSSILTCSELGNYAWDLGVPMPRIMFQSADCGKK